MKLIDKDALAAEIDRLKRELLQRKEQCRRRGLDKIMHQISILNKILSFLDTLEVKEVDLDESARLKAQTEKIVSEIIRLQDETKDKNGNYHSSYHEGIYDGLTKIELFLDTLK